MKIVDNRKYTGITLSRDELTVGNVYRDADDPGDRDLYMALLDEDMVNLATGLTFSGDEYNWVPVDVELVIKG